MFVYVGFIKEQIKVSTEGRNTIRVRGERLVAGNKWSRFLEDYQVPDNSEMNSVRARFQGGVLSITVPKTIPNRPQETILPRMSTDAKTEKQPQPQKIQDQVTPPVVTSQPTHEKISAPQKVIDATKQGILGEAQKVKDIITPLGLVPQRAEGREGNELKEKNVVAEGVKDLIRKMDEAGQHLKGSKQLPKYDAAENIKQAKSGPTSTGKDKASKQTETNQSSPGALTMEKYTNAVKGLTDINEDRQLLVNMGVGVLVIMALSAYVAYSFAAGKRDK